MGPVHYNYTTHRSIHEAWHIAHSSWLNHPGHCRKALGGLVMRDGRRTMCCSVWCVVQAECSMSCSVWFNEAGGGMTDGA